MSSCLREIVRQFKTRDTKCLEERHKWLTDRSAAVSKRWDHIICNTHPTANDLILSCFCIFQFVQIISCLECYSMAFKQHCINYKKWGLEFMALEYLYSYICSSSLKWPCRPLLVMICIHCFKTDLRRAWRLMVDAWWLPVGCIVLVVLFSCLKCAAYVRDEKFMKIIESKSPLSGKG